MEKNRDSFSQDLKQLIQESNNDYLKRIFENEFKEDIKGKKTLSLQFRASLDTLMKTLGVCHPYFIRTIKPNEFKRPQVNEVFQLLYRVLMFVQITFKIIAEK